MWVGDIVIIACSIVNVVRKFENVRQGRVGGYTAAECERSNLPENTKTEAQSTCSSISLRASREIYPVFPLSFCRVFQKQKQKKARLAGDPKGPRSLSNGPRSQIMESSLMTMGDFARKLQISTRSK